MEKGNVLILGESGVGKSTLINAILGEDVAATGWGTEGTTKELKIYEREDISFRLIDSVGFVPSAVQRNKAIHAVEKWSKQQAKAKKDTNTAINVIWFCVEGTRTKLFPQTINHLSRAISIWKSVPVIVVITKSYSIPDREKNIELVSNAFAMQKKKSVNLKKIIPVVAQTYVLNDTAYAPPAGITELIEITNDLLPEGKRAAKYDIDKYNLDRKRFMAQSTVVAATAAGAVVGAIPLPFTDAVLLIPTETSEIKAIARIFEADKKAGAADVIAKLIEAGTIGGVAKGIISGLKAIPGINIATSLINAVVAGVIVALIGELSIQAYEKVYLGKEEMTKLDWLEDLITQKMSNLDMDKISGMLKGEKMTKSELAKEIIEITLEEKDEPKS